MVKIASLNGLVKVENSLLLQHFETLFTEDAMHEFLKVLRTITLRIVIEKNMTLNRDWQY